MYYLGIDVGRHSHTAALINERGTLVRKPFRFDSVASGFAKLQEMLTEAVGPGDSLIVALEASGHYWLSLYEHLHTAGYDVRVLNPLQVSAFRNQGIRGTKTDRVDALLIAQVLRFGLQLERPPPDETLRALKQLTRYRADLTQQVVRTKNQVAALLDQVFPEYKAVFRDLFGAASLAVLAQAATPEELAAMELDTLEQTLRAHSAGRFGRAKAKELHQQALASFGVQMAAKAFGFQIKQIVDQIQYLQGQIKTLDEKIHELFQGLNCPLTTIPGIGETLGATIVAEVGDIQKFQHPKGGTTALVAFAGIDPRLVESGMHKGKAKMSKRGSRYLRRALHMASFVGMRGDAMFRQIYERQRARGKHHFIALSHVQNKLVHVIYSVLKHNRPYVPIEARAVS